MRAWGVIIAGVFLLGGCARAEAQTPDCPEGSAPVKPKPRSIDEKCPIDFGRGKGTQIRALPGKSKAVAPLSRGGNESVDSYSRAKKLARAVWTSRTTFYCGCRYDGEMVVEHASCGYVPRRPSARSVRVEWEHVVPAEAFGKSFIEWRDGHEICRDRLGRAFAGRNCARKANPLFRRMEADLYNLVPAVGEVNAARSNFSMAEIPGEAREFGACDVEMADRKVEPRAAVRGDIARIYLYLNQVYPGRGVVSAKNASLFEAWAAADPVDADECRRAARIRELQGNANPILVAACRAAGHL